LQTRSKLSTFVEIMMNLDWLVILGHKAIDVEMARKNKAMRRAYGSGGGAGGGGRASRDDDYGSSGGDPYGGVPRGGSGPGSESGSARSGGQLGFKRATGRAHSPGDDRSVSGQRTRY
jgi:hypothetical protein